MVLLHPVCRVHALHDSGAAPVSPMLFRKAVRSGSRNMDVRTAARTRYVCIGASVDVYASFAASLRARTRRLLHGRMLWPGRLRHSSLVSLVRQVLKKPRC